MEDMYGMADMADMADINNRIVAISYNVCFGCMSSNENSVNDVTSETLSQLCVAEAIAKDKNVCLNNVQTVFENVKKEFGPIDLVGIQESSKWDEIIDTPALKDLLYIHHKEVFEDMVSLYNYQKFKLDAIIIGNLHETQGRPYQILFLTHKLTDKKYIFINIHNGHKKHYKILEESLSKNSLAFIPKEVIHTNQIEGEYSKKIVVKIK